LSSIYDIKEITSYCDTYGGLYTMLHPKEGEHPIGMLHAIDLSKEDTRANILHGKTVISYILGYWGGIFSNTPPHMNTIIEYAAYKDESSFPTIMWLFWNSGIVLLPEDLIQLILKIDKIEISSEDYALLMFLSYQNEDIKKLGETMPLSTLKEMYEPLAKSNFEEWFKIQCDKLGLE
jgi:hypothetical protein